MDNKLSMFDLYNKDNEFSIRFKLDNNQQLRYIPNNIFSIHLPTIRLSDANEDDVDKTLKIVMRSLKDKSIEKELYEILMRTNFSVEVSLSNSNTTDYIYNDCSVYEIDFEELINRPKANPFNFAIMIKVKQMVVLSHGGDPMIFGRISDMEKLGEEENGN